MFLECFGGLIVCNSVDLEEKCFRRLLNPTVFFNTNDLSFFISVVVNMGDCDLLAGVVELPMSDVEEEQTEKLLLGFMDLGRRGCTFYF